MVVYALGAGENGNAWHAHCLIFAMMQIPAVDQAFLLFLLVSCLGTCLVRALWELEQIRARRIASPPRQRVTKRD
ncbi:hypothetical protein AOQ71_30265 [Bradyrhizobium manausense]|uniref:Uncharacterized protein n=1 Tax=Bradyrhizobium manausense TaxID=989370 RepID=A0A0R3D6H6_9BRAD|nr:hypothetical protein AOQ71_30265 [Bradyrhizobium manausense]